jgi:hypothetical protein
MRALAAHGWLNFRMRAMLVSFASYQLWLPWRATGLHLARQFVDYEPGIHWSQVQMQSGTTGINTMRVYNPVKQGHDQDPEGVFVRRWVPEVADVPTPADPRAMALGRGGQASPTRRRSSITQRPPPPRAMPCMRCARDRATVRPRAGSPRSTAAAKAGMPTTDRSPADRRADLAAGARPVSRLVLVLGDQLSPVLSSSLRPQTRRATAC